MPDFVTPACDGHVRRRIDEDTMLSKRYWFRDERNHQART